MCSQGAQQGQRGLLTEIRSHRLDPAEDRYYHGFVGKITVVLIFYEIH